jgi:hypothetical protein
MALAPGTKLGPTKSSRPSARAAWAIGSKSRHGAWTAAPGLLRRIRLAFPTWAAGCVPARSGPSSRTVAHAGQTGQMWEVYPSSAKNGVLFTNALVRVAVSQNCPAPDMLDRDLSSQVGTGKTESILSHPSFHNSRPGEREADALVRPVRIGATLLPLCICPAVSPKLGNRFHTFSIDSGNQLPIYESAASPSIEIKGVLNWLSACFLKRHGSTAKEVLVPGCCAGSSSPELRCPGSATGTGGSGIRPEVRLEVLQLPHHSASSE